MPYQQSLAWFEKQYPGQGAQKYAAEIQRKQAAGATYSDPAAATAFRQAYPQYFGAGGASLRNVYSDTAYNPATKQVGVGGATFQAGQIPGTQFTGGTHYVTDKSALQAAIEAQLGRQAAGAPAAQPATAPQPTSAAGFDMRAETSPEVQAMLNQIRGYINQPPQTPDELLQSEYGQQLQAAADTMRDQQMRQARAQLAASGGLYPDDTRAAERFGQVGAEAAQMQAGQILPALLAAAQGQRSAGLNELLAGLGAQTGEEAAALNRILGTFQATAPYQYLTEYQRQTLPLEWAGAIGEVPGGTIPGSVPSEQAAGFVPARQYVEQLGGRVTWRRAPDGGNIITVNGVDIDVEAVGGENRGGRIFLPQYVIDQVMGVR
jgi:hypothetical protein